VESLIGTQLLLCRTISGLASDRNESKGCRRWLRRTALNPTEDTYDGPDRWTMNVETIRPGARRAMDPALDASL